MYRPGGRIESTYKGEGEERIMVWKFVEQDQMSLDQLKKWKKFFILDLQHAEEQLKEAEEMAKKFDLPNERDMIKKAKKNIKTSQKNLEIVKEAIKLAIERNV